MGENVRALRREHIKRTLEELSSHVPSISTIGYLSNMHGIISNKYKVINSVFKYDIHEIINNKQVFLKYNINDIKTVE